MLLQKDNWRLGYHQIISDCRPSATSPGGTVLILCNPDADALCAARILSYAFRADKIPYQLRPCGGFARLKYILQKLHLNPLQQLQSDEEDEMQIVQDYMASSATVRAVILLNLGGMHNLQRALFEPSAVEVDGVLNTEPALLHMDLTKVFILDSHRPYHLNNVHAGSNIVLWNDYNHWHESSGGVPSDGDDLSGNEDSSDEEDEEDDDDSDEGSSKDGSDDDSEGEAEFGDEEITSRKDDQINKITDSKVDDEESGTDADDESDQDTIDPSPSKRRPGDMSSPSKSKRQRSDPNTPDTELDSDIESDSESTPSKREISQPPMSQMSMGMRERHQDRKDRIKKYYASGSFHSSPVAFMTYTLLAEQLRHRSIGDLLWLACVGVTDAFVHNRLDISGYIKLACMLQEHVEDIYPSSANDKLRGFASVDGMKIAMSQNGKIVTQKDELRFFLLRHTSLFEAMVLSPDLNTRMELWRTSGMKKLRELLASMGLPLSQCQQPYAFMKPALKRKLKEEVMLHEEVGIFRKRLMTCALFFTVF
jgi:cell division control protein 45